MVAEAGLGVPDSLLRGVGGSLGMLTLVVDAGGVPEATVSPGLPEVTSPGPGVVGGTKDSAVRETVLGGSFLETEVEVEESSRAERCVEESEEEAEEERRGGGEDTRGSSSPLMVQLSWPGPSRCWGKQTGVSDGRR
ncbi:hypothetical protein E2C01_032838 [Portunus trituberculatus]|uniref:Uncharacterized protein n=1 Tax=Portunus trituberculatus TaxID=210409 RepID=A0A5B7F295_PORTR|nr:hypothetical protein [Portunus trituberculatus]